VNLLRIARPAGDATEEDLAAVRAGLAALGRPVPDGALERTSHLAQGASAAGRHMTRTAFGPLVVEVAASRIRASRGPAAAGRALAAEVLGGVAFASDARTLWGAGVLPRRFDPGGLAAVLWRGGAVEARLPAAGVRALRPRETVAVSASEPLSPVPPPLVAAPAPRATPGDAERALEAAVGAALADARMPLLLLGSSAGGAAVAAAAVAAVGRAGLDAVTIAGYDPWLDEPQRGARIAWTLGVRHHVVPLGPLDPEEALAAWTSATDFPSASGLATWCVSAALRRAGATVVLSGAGARALFGRGRPFADRRRRLRAAALWPPLARGRPGGDPMDARAQRRRELRAFVRVPAKWAHAHAALLPAVTRDAVSLLGPRPADDLVPAPGDDREVLSDLARLGRLSDLRLRDSDAAGEALGLDVRFPLLDDPFVEAVRGLDPDLRFRGGGSWGWLGARLAARGVLPPPALRGGFAPRYDAWLRGPLASWLSRTLARDRLEHQRVFVPDAVADALARFRARRSGWTAERILLVALVTDWVERHGLARDEGP
jgi:hypothetical protein